MATSHHHPPRTVGVSLKMYFDLESTAAYIRACTPLAAHALTHNVDLFLIPDFLSLQSASTALRLSAPSIRLGAQDCFWEDAGAYTGEVSPASLHAAGCSLVELGHAERRRIFGESDEQVARKAAAAERNSLTPLVCIGEKVQGTVEDVVRECRPQIKSVLEVTQKEVIFAYEPVWAIGKPAPAPAAYVVEVVKALRGLCGGRQVRFLYGGSAGPGTFEEMREGVDGLFLGRFAHDPERLRDVIAEVGS
jgi:triosephosphate isomerase